MIATAEYKQISLAAARALAGSEEADFAIYMPALGAGDPVLYREQAAGLAMPDFGRMLESGVHSLLVRARDLHKCEQLVEEKLSEILTAPDVPAGEKATILHSVGATIARDLIGTGNNRPDLLRARNYVEESVRGLLADPAISGCVLQMAQHERSVASHMMFVSALAVLLGTEVYGNDPDSLRDLGLAGMLHDLGKLSVDPQILHKVSSLMHEEALMVQQHPIESVRLIGDDPNANMSVRQMIVQHHERVDGKGYPIGTAGPDLLPGSRILSIVDSFHAMLSRHYYCRVQTPVEANRFLERQAGKWHDDELVKAWSSLFSRNWSPDFDVKNLIIKAKDSEPGSRHEHSSLPATSSLNTPYPVKPCNGKAMVRCFYAGRLKNVSTALSEFVAPLHEISRGGLSIFTPNPIYPGEIIHVEVGNGENPAWMRGTVIWCRQQNDQMYKSGIFFLERISEDQARREVDVTSLTELGSSQAAYRRDEEAAKRGATRKPVTARESALRTLDGLAVRKRLAPEEGSTAVTLAMSGDADVRLRAIDILVRLQTGAARQTLMHMINDSEPAIRIRALQGIAELGLIEGAYRVRSLITNEDPRVAAEATRTLERLHKALQTVGATVKPPGAPTRFRRGRGNSN